MVRQRDGTNGPMEEREGEGSRNKNVGGMERMKSEGDREREVQESES